MYTFIKMEYLVANALVELYESKNERKISIDVIKEYGFNVEQRLLKKNVKAILLYSNEYTRELLDDYSDLFELKENFICIKDGKTIDDIRKAILYYVPVDILLEMINSEVIARLKV